MKKIIVTQRIDYIDNYNETRESIDQALIELLVNCNFIPIPISNKLITHSFSNTHSKKHQNLLDEFLSLTQPNALILSGGNDIGEYTDRDETENFLLNWASKNKKPVLGICRGMQMINHWAGGKLSKVSNFVGKSHNLLAVANKKKWPNKVKSYHNWAISECPPDFEIKVNYEDDIIAAIKHKFLPWEAWMWHPEREERSKEINLNRLKDLINK